jgi:hypothetical protein
MRNGLELRYLRAQQRLGPARCRVHDSHPQTPPALSLRALRRGGVRACHRKGTTAVIRLLTELTSLLTALLQVLVVGVLWGSERIYQRRLELIRVLRGKSSQSDTTPPRRDVDRLS